MDNKISFDSLVPVFINSLENNKKVTFKPGGTSMLPALLPDCDAVTLRSPVFPLKKYSVVFYRRKDNSYVLHRIVGKNENGYILCGDNQAYLEYGVGEDMIIGEVTEVSHKGKTYSGENYPSKKYCKKLFLKRFKKRLNLKIKSMLK